MRWQFKNRAPASIKIVFALLCVNFVGQLAMSLVIPQISPITPDTAHPYLAHFKGMAGYYVQPWLGMYFDYQSWAQLVLLVVLIVLFWTNRDQIERIS